MKYMIASDLHGSAKYTRLLLEAFEREKADRLVLLGDLLYHGPRNPLPEEYDTKEVTKLLNATKDKILSIRGNCDSEVDQMVLEFPCLADYAVIPLKNATAYFSHGHVYNEENLLPMMPGDLLFNGHFHKAYVKEVGENKVINPGSLSLPKDDFRGYILLTEESFAFCTLDGTKQKEYTI